MCNSKFEFPGAVNEGTIKCDVVQSGRGVPTFQEIPLFDHSRDKLWYTDGGSSWKFRGVLFRPKTRPSKDINVLDGYELGFGEHLQ